MVGTDARRSVAMEGACSRLAPKTNQCCFRENKMTLVSPDGGISKKIRTSVGFARRTISCTPDRRTLAEKLVFYCLAVTRGVRRRVLSSGLAASNSCTARNSCQTAADTFPPRFGRPIPLCSRESRLACLARRSAPWGGGLLRLGQWEAGRTHA